jgi:predicted nucleic acid-binding protein
MQPQNPGIFRCITVGLNVVGVLVEAKHKSLIPHLKPILDELITRAGFRVSPQLYERVLQAVGESP